MLEKLIKKNTKYTVRVCDQLTFPFNCLNLSKGEKIKEKIVYKLI